MLTLTSPAFASDPLVIYSSRKEVLIRHLLDQFTEKTGVEVQLLNEKAPKLLARMQLEGKNTPADIFLTVDIANLIQAKEKGFLSPITSDVLNTSIPEDFRDPDQQWFGLSKRIRTLFYNTSKVKPEQLSTYENLSDPAWKGEILIRSSSNTYNQSLVANLIAKHGKAWTADWAKGLVSNMARTPQGGDTDQIKALAAGQGSIAVANHYYYLRMVHSDDPQLTKAASNIAVFFPNQDGADGELNGVHNNISGAGVVVHSDQKENATNLLEYLVSEEAQTHYAEVNREFPIRANLGASKEVEGLGAFTTDDTPLSVMARFVKTATFVADEAGWK